MKYEIDFDNNAYEAVFMELYHFFEWSERSFEDKDLPRNITNTVNFECTVKELHFLGADTQTGTYQDNGFIRIGYARINSHTFITNGRPNYQELKEALWEIAHPEAKERVWQ